MGALAQLSTTVLDVEPGRSATMAVTVRNTGTVVDRYSFEVLGTAAPWVTFSPDTLSLFPEASGTVNIVFSPPRDSTATAGPVPFGLRVASSEDPSGSVVEEGTLVVAPFSDVSLELLPRIPAGRMTARGQVAVDNRSNCAYRAEVAAADPKEALGFGFRPKMLDIPAGAAVFVKMAISPKKRFWKGPPKTLPFSVVLGTIPDSPTTPGPHRPQIMADGSMLQEALVPGWLVKALAALLALAVLLALLWFLLFQPQLKNTAKNEAKQQLAAAGIVPASGGAAKTAGGTSSAVTAPPPVTTPPTTSVQSVSSTPTTPTTATTVPPTPINGSFTAAGNGSTVFYTVPTGKTLEVTDMLVQNPTGSVGTVSLARNGVTLIQWSMDTFRDLDYHWITPTVVNAGQTLQLTVSGCPQTCDPGIYYSGQLSKA